MMKEMIVIQKALIAYELGCERVWQGERKAQCGGW